VLKDGPEIDVTAIKGRRSNTASGDNGTSSGGSSKKTFSEVYKEAQEMFKAKMKLQGTVLVLRQENVREDAIQRPQLLASSQHMRGLI
jgi:hypothetical protein